MKIDFSRYYDCLNKSYWHLVTNTSRFQILKGGSGCVHPETKIHTENGLTRICDIDKPTRVLSWNQKSQKYQLSLSGGSFPKGRDFLYQVSTKHGEFLSSGHHRILLSSGEYQRVDKLHPDDEISQAQISPSETNSESSQSMYNVDVQSFSQKAVDLLGNYADAVRQYDPLPQEVGDYALFSQPSKHDAQEPSHSYLTFPEKGQGKSLTRNHLYLYDGRTYKNHFYAKGLCASPFSEDCTATSFSERTLHFPQEPPQFQMMTECHHTKEQFDQIEPSQPFFLGDSLKPPIVKYSTVLSSTTPILSIKKVGFSEYWCMQVLDTNNYICENGVIHHNSGKSHFIAQDEVYKQLFFPGTNLLVVRQTGKSNRTSTFPLIKQVINAFGVQDLFKINKTEMTITCLVNGNEIRFGGLDDVEKLKSITFTSGPLSRIWIEEASETKESDFNQLNLRLRGQSPVPFQIRLSFNPISAMHWIKGRFFDMPDERKRTEIHHSTYLDNEYIDEEYKKELERLKDIDKVFYDVYCLGKWGVFGNLIFTNWEAKVCPYKLEDFDEVLSGMDFGFNHPLAWELVGFKDGEVWSIDELYVREQTNIEVVQKMDKTGQLDKTQKCTADSAEPARIKEWCQNGYRVEGAVKGKDSVSRGIDYLKSLKWYIDPEKCPGLLAEVQSYSYKEDKFGNKTDDPVNFKDDAIAAIRYAVEEKALSNQSVFFA